MANARARLVRWDSPPGELPGRPVCKMLDIKPFQVAGDPLIDCSCTHAANLQARGYILINCGVEKKGFLKNH